MRLGVSIQETPLYWCNLRCDYCHGAGWLLPSDNVYGDCLASFIASNSRRFRGSHKPLSNRDHRWMTKKAHWVQGGAKQVGEEQLRTLLSNSTVIGLAGGTPANASFGTLGNADAEFSGGYNLKTKKDFDFKLVGQQLCSKNDLGDGCFSLYVMPASA